MHATVLRFSVWPQGEHNVWYCRCVCVWFYRATHSFVGIMSRGESCYCCTVRPRTMCPVCYRRPCHELSPGVMRRYGVVAHPEHRDQELRRQWLDSGTAKLATLKRMPVSATVALPHHASCFIHNFGGLCPFVSAGTVWPAS